MVCLVGFLVKKLVFFTGDVGSNPTYPWPKIYPHKFEDKFSVSVNMDRKIRLIEKLNFYILCSD